MIRVNISLANATVTETETLTAGRVGLECAFTFSSEWDGLSKVAVFEGAETIEVALGTANVAVVPPECMATAGYSLRVGAYGLSTANAIVIPTIWAKAGKIKDSAAPDDESFAPATPELVAQIIAASEDALEIARNVKERADSGAFDGADGQDGISPTVMVEEIEGGHRVTITDADGEHIFDVMDGTNGTDGADGDPGQDGADGADGVSPTVTVTEISGGHRVTITDADHPQGQSFDVMDGTGGGGGTGPSPYSSNPAPLGTASPGSSDAYSRGDHVHPKPSAADIGAYAKPSGGIPKTDLASTVQTSLGKADTALQSYTETDPTVPSWAKASSKPSYTASEVGAIEAPSSPSSGAFLVWNGSAWVAQTLSTWQASSY